MPSGPDVVTWSVLLSKWTEFARASAAFPKDAEGERWRASVAPIISLQAITFALGELDALTDPDERPVALDRAAVGAREAATALHDAWRGHDLPDGIRELIDDANTALAAARHAGVEWTLAADRFTAPHPAELAEALRRAGFTGDLFAPSPGVTLVRTEPVIFAREDPHAAGGGPPRAPEVAAMIAEYLACEAEPSVVPGPRQVYRQFDFAKGGVSRDYVCPIEGELPPGQPLLAPVMEAGEPLPVAIPPRAEAPPENLEVAFAAEETSGGAEGTEGGAGHRE